MKKYFEYKDDIEKAKKEEERKAQAKEEEKRKTNSIFSNSNEPLDAISDNHLQYLKKLANETKAPMQFDKYGSVTIKYSESHGFPYDTTGYAKMYYDSLRVLGVSRSEAKRMTDEMFHKK